MISKSYAFILAAWLLGMTVLPAALWANNFSKYMKEAAGDFRDGQLESAIAEYQKALEIKPNSLEAQSWLGLAYEQWGDSLLKVDKTDLAIEAYQNAVAAVSDDPYWREQLGNALEKKGDHESAMKEFRIAATLSPFDNGLQSKAGMGPAYPPGARAEKVTASKTGEEAEKAKVVVSRPVPIHKPEPKYSARARQAKLQGTVFLWMVIDAEGNVSWTEVVKPLGLGLDASVLNTVRTWKFKPAMREGIPVPVKVKVEVAFKLF